MSLLANAIRTDTSNEFAHRTITTRNPRLLRQVLELNPDYTPAIQASLERLCQDLLDDAPIPMLDLPAPDYESWFEAWQSRQGQTWQATDWFFAETYFYRLVMQAVRWFETQRDPFAPNKAEEYASPALWSLLDSALEIDGPLDQRLATLLEFTLWGNRIDLSYAEAAAHGTDTHAEDLLVDERVPAVEQILRASGPVHLVTDNAGTELTMDLVLVDALLQQARIDSLLLHLKWHPTYVSDATVPDILEFIRDLQSGTHSRAADALGQRLQIALEQGRLRLAPDPFWNSSRYLWEMPSRLQQTFRNARLVLIKGDANYRRVVGDVVWPADLPLGQRTADFPAPLLLLRTMKSDAVVGLPPGLAEQLDSLDDQWRINGRRGVIQSVIRSSL